MTPKEKADAIVISFEEKVATHHYNFQRHQAIQCAKILVCEVIEEINQIWLKTNDQDLNNLRYKFWQEVKTEIEKF